MMLNATETRDIAREAAREAVRETLVSLGVDMTDPESVIEMQKDFAHVRLWRRSTETMRRTAMTTAIVVIVSGFLGAVWLIFRPGA